ncbi:MAG: hypothetical protein K9N34_09975 [Candidatus Marinimicrobia bacterium]|nr:hypothetical protein [Candidatus Neomarinimicrobiota bacterium]
MAPEKDFTDLIFWFFFIKKKEQENWAKAPLSLYFAIHARLAGGSTEAKACGNETPGAF